MCTVYSALCSVSPYRKFHVLAIQNLSYSRYTVMYDDIELDCCGEVHLQNDEFKGYRNYNHIVSLDISLDNKLQ